MSTIKEFKMLEVNDDLNKGLFKNSPFKYKGEKYYYMDGNIVDSSFITPSDSLVTEITNLLYKLFDYKLYPTAVVLQYIKETKKHNSYNLAITAIEYLLNERNDSVYYVRIVLPILTSIYRECGKSQTAIEQGEKFLSLSYKYKSAALLTSLAAAYCDIKNYIKAKQLANEAWAISGFSPELSSVFQRIKANTEK